MRESFDDRADLVSVAMNNFVPKFCSYQHNHEPKKIADRC